MLTGAVRGVVRAQRARRSATSRRPAPPHARASRAAASGLLRWQAWPAATLPRAQAPVLHARRAPRAHISRSRARRRASASLASSATALPAPPSSAPVRAPLRAAPPLAPVSQGTTERAWPPSVPHWPVSAVQHADVADVPELPRWAGYEQPGHRYRWHRGLCCVGVPCVCGRPLPASGGDGVCPGAGQHIHCHQRHWQHRRGHVLCGHEHSRKPGAVAAGALCGLCRRHL
jgi:hypothetical protein